jgi:hypothetical protein
MMNYLRNIVRVSVIYFKLLPHKKCSELKIKSTRSTWTLTPVTKPASGTSCCSVKIGRTDDLPLWKVTSLDLPVRKMHPLPSQPPAGFQPRLALWAA